MDSLSFSHSLSFFLGPEPGLSGMKTLDHGQGCDPGPLLLCPMPGFQSQLHVLGSLVGIEHAGAC